MFSYRGNILGVFHQRICLDINHRFIVRRTHSLGQGITGAKPIKSSEPNSYAYPRLPIDANQIKRIKNSLLTPWFWLMPNRSCNKVSYKLNFYWKLRMDCFAMQSFPPKEGMSWNKLITFGTQTRNRSYDPQSCTSSYIMGSWTFLCGSLQSSLINPR